MMEPAVNREQVVPLVAVGLEQVVPLAVRAALEAVRQDQAVRAALEAVRQD